MKTLRDHKIPNLTKLLGRHHDDPDWRYEFTVAGRVVSLDYLGDGLVVFYEADGGPARRYVLHRLNDEIPAAAEHVAAAQTLHLYLEPDH